ncbi:MAG: GNAT family N-acetyltransferase [Bacillota bacterium]|nr:GNAT family N-acetyltransferase [Bacillota bacterium]
MQLKSGKQIIIREAERDDAEQMINFYNFVGGETDFLSFGKGDFKKNLLEYQNYIEDIKKELNSIILLAVTENEIIGIATINSNQKARTRHVGVLGIVIEKRYWGLGLGRNLMNLLIHWAKSNNITKKITLLTNENNKTARDLYKKVGFMEEGLLTKDNYINGVYYNTVIMGLIL